MNSKKGFTLVELLAVIVILAVLVLLAVPNVLKSINSSRKSTFSIEASSIIEAAKIAYLEKPTQTCFTLDNLKTYLDSKSWTEYNGYVLISTDSNNHKIWLTNGILAINGSVTPNIVVSETAADINAVKNRTNCN